MSLEIPGGKVEVKLFRLISSTLSSTKSKMAVCIGPFKLFRLKFKWVKLDKYRISGGIVPKRLRRERSRLEILDVLAWHLIPDQEHQTGSFKLGLEKIGVGSQFWKVERGPLREVLRERRAISWELGGGDDAERTIDICRKRK